MRDTTELSVPKNLDGIISFFLFLYPKQYRNKFGQEIRLLVTELYQEERNKKGTVGLGFWFSQAGDVTKSVIEQHIDEIGKKGMMKYVQNTLHINKFNVIGGILLLPAITVFFIDVFSRIVQGDLAHYNHPVYSFMSHTPLYWQPVLVTWVIVFPLLAVGINLIPLLKNLITKHHNKIKSWNFLWQNLITLLLLGFGTFFILLVKFHDFGPCMLHGIARLGFEHFNHIVEVCNNA